MSEYPQCLIDELTALGKRPTGNVEWDRAILQVMKKRRDESRPTWSTLDAIVARTQKQIDKAKIVSNDLVDPDIYAAHCEFLIFVANEVVLKTQRRQFVIDDNNRRILRFMLYYFNGCPLCEEVFPDRGYKLHKNLLLQGGVGVGKTLLMQIFSEYLRLTGNPRFFHNLSVTQMVNYYTIHNNLDRYTYNEENSTGFMPNPVNVCLNDIGLESRLHYGQDTKILTNDFLHARNEIWTQSAPDRRKFAHLTTNLSIAQLKEEFKDAFGRLVDRFKTYNVIELKGSSRR